MGVRIAKITTREILDSRGEPTVKVTVLLRGGPSASDAVPAGASTGSHEALELRRNHQTDGLHFCCAFLYGNDSRVQRREDCDEIVSLIYFDLC